MVAFATDYMENESLIQQWERPDFSSWVSAEIAATYLESIGQNQLAQEARKVQQLSKYPVNFVLAPPWVAAFVTPWNSNVISYNLHTLGRNADHEHIVRHESIHLEHQAKWGNTDVPGFNRLSSVAQSCFADALGTALTERELLEWHTETKATAETEYDPDCSYNLHEVPLAGRFNALVENRSKLSGKTLSTSQAFNNMWQDGSREQFEEAMILTANQLMLEEAAGNLWVKVDDALATKISFIARENMRNGKVFETLEEAENALKTTPIWVATTTVSVRDRITKIGVTIEDPFRPEAKKNTNTGVNIFGDTLEKKNEGNEWKVVQKNTADKAVNVLKIAPWNNELGLAA